MAYLDFSNKRYSKDQLADLRAMLVKLNSSTLMPEEAGSITLDEFKEWLEGAVDAYVDENQDSLKGPKGDTGSVGATGVGIQNIANYYAATNTSATPPLSEITSPTIPTMSSYNKYLWKKEITTFTDNSTSSAISLAGVYGDTGSQGAQGPQGPQGIQGPAGADGSDGIGIQSITYLYATSQTQSGTKSTYQTTMPTLSATNKYLWQKETINFTSGDPKVTEAIIGTYGDKGDTGATGEQGPQGVSATHEWNGTVLTITSASGTSSANLKGPAGPAGEKGEDGKDYILTSEDKEEIAQNATSEFRSEVTGLNSSLTEVTETVDAHDALIDETSKIATDNKARLHGYDFRKVDRNPSFILDGDGEASLKQMMDSVDAYPQDAIMLSLEPIIPTASQHNFGIRGQIACDDSYLYVCVAENEWKKIPLQNL